MSTGVNDLATEILNDLVTNAGDFALPFTAEKTRKPLTTLQENDATLHVFIVPTSRFLQPKDRSTNEQNYDVQLGVITRITDDRSEDEIFQFLEDLWNFYPRRHFPQDVSPQTYQWKRQREDFIYDYEDLIESDTVKSVFTLTYQTWF